MTNTNPAQIAENDRGPLILFDLSYDRETGTSRLLCIDYGHHGRERCVTCGLPNPTHSDGDPRG